MYTFIIYIKYIYILKSLNESILLLFLNGYGNSVGKRKRIGTDALLLSLLSASREDAEAAYATVRAAFPDVEPEAVAGYLQQRAEEGEGGPSQSTRDKKKRIRI